MNVRDGLRSVLSACPFACPAVAVASSIAAVDQQNYWLLAITLAAVAVAFMSRPLVWGISIFLAVLAGGLHSYRLSNQALVEGLYGDWWEGEMRAESEVVNGRLELSFSDGELDGQRVVASIDPDSTEAINVGDLLQVEGRVLSPEIGLNPNVFPEKQWLHRRGVDAKMLLRKVELQQSGSGGIVSWATKVRQWARARVSSEVHPLQSAVVCAMVLGERPREAQQVVDDFRKSGTIHVFAVSGLHVMMVGSIVAVVLRLLGCPRWLWVPLVIASLFFYALVTGMRPPAMRAAMMGSVVLSAWLVRRKIVLANSVALCASLALLWDGHLLFVTGFQLSFAVLIAIALMGGVIAKLLGWITYVDPFLPRSLYSKFTESSLWLRRKVQGATTVGSCAWFGATPLTWWNFGLLAPLSIVVSLPMVLLLYGVLLSSFVSLALGSVWTPLGDRGNLVSYWLAERAVHIAEVGAKAHVSEASWSEGERVVIYAMPDGEAAVYLGIGGGTMLDVGSESGFKYQVLPSLLRKGARVDSVIVSHGDVQHSGGLELLGEHFSLKQAVLPVEMRLDSTKVVRAQPQQTLPLSDTARLELIHAVEHYHGLADDRCSVLRLHWGGLKVLFVNDAGFRFEQWVLENRVDVSADVLVIGKHAYDHSGGIDFIRAVNPSRIVVQGQSLGARAWLGELRARGYESHCTGECGAVMLERVDGKLTFSTQKGGALRAK